MRRRKISTENLGSATPLFNHQVNETFTQVVVWEHPPAGYDGDKELVNQFYGPSAKLRAAEYADYLRHKGGS